MCYFGDSTCELCHIENGALKYEIVSLLDVICTVCMIL